MKTVAIESLRRHLGSLLRSEEPVLVTRYGRLAGVFYPMQDPKKLAARFEAIVAKRKPKKRAADPQLPLLRGD